MDPGDKLVNIPNGTTVSGVGSLGSRETLGYHVDYHGNMEISPKKSKPNVSYFPIYYPLVMTNIAMV